jgi:hypothetical protein
MAELVTYLRRTCDVVILCAPADAAQTHTLTALSDAVVVVAREETVTREAAEFWSLGTAPIGLVLAR